MDFIWINQIKHESNKSLESFDSLCFNFFFLLKNWNWNLNSWTSNLQWILPGEEYTNSSKMLMLLLFWVQCMWFTLRVSGYISFSMMFEIYIVYGAWNHFINSQVLGKNTALEKCNVFFLRDNNAAQPKKYTDENVS